MTKLPSLDKFRRQSSVAESQQFYDTMVVEAETHDNNVRTIGEEISTISTKNLELIINYIDKLVTTKVEGADSVADAAEFNKMKGYVAGLKDLKRLFKEALQEKRK